MLNLHTDVELDRCIGRLLVGASMDEELLHSHATVPTQGWVLSRLFRITMLIEAMERD